MLQCKYVIEAEKISKGRCVMVKTLTKHGNSLALVIDKPILELLKIDADTPLEITTDGQSLVISPASVDRQAKFRKAADDTFEKYPNMLQRLAQ
jgi:antitoxin MazE